MATQAGITYTPAQGQGWTESIGSTDDARVLATLQAFARGCGQDSANMTARQLARFWLQESWRRTVRLAQATREAEELQAAQAAIKAELGEMA
jgi:hypothetical protein